MEGGSRRRLESSTLLEKFGKSRWRVKHGRWVEHIAVVAVHCAEFGLADADCFLKHGLEYGLQLAWRRTYDAEDFRCRGLLLQRLAQLVEQADVVNRDHRLRREHLQQI